MSIWDDIFGGTTVGPDPDLDPDGVYGPGPHVPQRPANDFDADGLTDEFEVEETGTDPQKADTDGDGLSDRQEFDGTTDPRNKDSDGDRLTDGQEVNTYHTDPNVADTDRDGRSDYDEVNVLDPIPSTGPSPFGDAPAGGQAVPLGVRFDPASTHLTTAAAQSDDTFVASTDNLDLLSDASATPLHGLADLAPGPDADFGAGAAERAADLARYQEALEPSGEGGSDGGADERAADLARHQEALGPDGDGPAVDPANVDPDLVVLTPGGGVPFADGAIAKVEAVDPPVVAPDPIPEPEPEPLAELAGVRDLDLSNAELAVDDTPDAGPYAG